MTVLICYDIKTDTEYGAQRLRKVASACERFGIRVQNSVFELDLTPGDFASLKIELTNIIDTACDSVRIYRLGKNAKERTEILGSTSRIELHSPLIL